ncbi:MAG: metalloregulator ArsR/SmtB family transcription factor [Geminicoccales bacterium]
MAVQQEPRERPGQGMDDLLKGLRAAAEPTRLRLLALCAHGELTVGELTQILAQSQPRVSRHLRLLAEAGLLERFQEGTHAFFRLTESGPLADLARVFVDSIAADDPRLALDLERLEGIKKARAAAAAAYFRENAARWDRIRSLYVDEAEVEQAVLDALAEKEIDDLLDIGDWDKSLEWIDDNLEKVGGDSYSFSKEVVRVWGMRHSKATITQGVRTNSVCPAPIDTPLLTDFRATMGDKVIDFATNQATGMLMTPREVAMPLAFLGSEAASYVNGHDLIADGGFTAKMATGQLDYSGLM